MNAMSRLVAATLLCVATICHAAGVLYGRVESVHDGDTLTAVVNGQRLQVRVADIDAPELQQPFGQAAQRALAALCGGAEIVIRPKTKDAYGRVVAEVDCNGKDAGIGMAAAGYAWSFTKYAPRKVVVDAADRARREQRGLWVATNPQAPWDYRAGRSTSADAHSQAGGGAGRSSVESFLSRVPEVGLGGGAVGGSRSSGTIGGGGGSSSGTVYVGPRGGQYVIGSGGEKQYLDRNDPRRR